METPVNATVEIEPGMPVEIGKIDRELGKLWEDIGDTKTRASLINLAIYTENAESISANTELISQIASKHACRALLIFANPDSPRERAKAWISAHCHLAGKGDRQICSEQITFQLDGGMITALPNIVFSHLDSDLPLCFWWQGNFSEPLDKKLWEWVDRLIYDSADWNAPPEQFAIVQKIRTLTEIRTVLCDLNWTRLLGARFALAQLFDHSCALARINNIERVSISCADRTTGLLLLGWLAAQLGWKLQLPPGSNRFLSAAGTPVEFEIEVTDGLPISRCAFQCPDSVLEIARQPASEYYRARIDCEGVSNAVMLVPAGKSEDSDILLIELSRGGKHPLYRKALAAVEPLFT
ncbi:MAG: glucose-6-phosphate dehydrogenase assembly protein OpcA [Terrimicrobiaceae bacterium]